MYYPEWTFIRGVIPGRSALGDLERAVEARVRLHHPLNHVRWGPGDFGQCCVMRGSHGVIRTRGVISFTTIRLG